MNTREAGLGSHWGAKPHRLQRWCPCLSSQKAQTHVLAVCLTDVFFHLFLPSIHKLRENVFQEHQTLKEKELETGPKASHGYGGKFGVEQDRMDKVSAGPRGVRVLVCLTSPGSAGLSLSPPPPLKSWESTC